MKLKRWNFINSVCFVVILFRVSKPFMDISREVSKKLTEKKIVTDEFMHWVLFSVKGIELFR